MGLREQWGLEAVTKSLHDPFEEKPKSFQKVKTMIEEEEILRTAPAVTVKPKLEAVKAEKKIGRPKSDKPKPWDGTGLSKSDYYRKKSKGEV
jgi:hypothetical protein